MCGACSKPYGHHADAGVRHPQVHRTSLARCHPGLAVEQGKSHPVGVVGQRRGGRYGVDLLRWSDGHAEAVSWVLCLAVARGDDAIDQSPVLGRYRAQVGGPGLLGQVERVVEGSAPEGLAPGLLGFVVAGLGSSLVLGPEDAVEVVQRRVEVACREDRHDSTVRARRARRGWHRCGRAGSGSPATTAVRRARCRRLGAATGAGTRTAARPGPRRARGRRRPAPRSGPRRRRWTRIHSEEHWPCNHARGRSTGGRNSKRRIRSATSR